MLLYNKKMKKEKMMKTSIESRLMVKILSDEVYNNEVATILAQPGG
jgi:hypothetical protein